MIQQTMKRLYSYLLLAFVLLPSLVVAMAGTDTVYQSDQLIITRIAKHSYVHTSYLYTNSFGKVPCNGMIVLNKNEAVVFDTPANDTSTIELLNWIQTAAKSKIKAIIPTHFHEDCLGGLKAFHQYQIPSYANNLTITLAKAQQYTVPVNGFTDQLMLTVGGEKIYTRFFGEGHTKDNVVGYFPTDQILFGGCLIKELNATKGFLGDANIKAWPTTVENIRKSYPNVKIVIPGHGDSGNKALLDYTIRLFSK
jgi:metallo-beta-lactamase class B